MAWVQFTVAAVLIIIAGTKLTRSADALGKWFGLGSGWAGVLLLPLATSLPEFVTTLRATTIQAPDLAVGNLFGSNLFNITIIALVDILQGKGSLLYRVRQGHVLAATLGIVLMAMAALAILLPLPTLWGSWLGVSTLIIFGTYLLAAKLLTMFEKKSFFPEEEHPLGSDGKKTGESTPLASYPPRKAFMHFILSSVVILGAGIALTDASDIIAIETGLGRTFVGSIMLAVATSLPEVVTTSTAVRLGKIEMAMGNIFGANVFNMFILSIVDIFYLDGPLLQTISTGHIVTALMGIILTSIAIIGLVYRSQRSIGWIGFDSILIVFVYLIAFSVLFFL